jgi:D-serine deaminase-like pyridoxal phosphate-dependent protein
MHISDTLLESLETPCIVIDVEKARSNIIAMQKAADEAGCKLRPHVKTHKMPFFAKMQMEAGAVGITCAKVSEAEVMAAGGLDDIFIAYPMVGSFRIQRAIALGKNIKRLILGVDSFQGAVALSEAATEAGVILELRLEIDTGLRRTGIPPEEAPDLAMKIVEMPGLELTGIYTFKGLLYEGKFTNDNRLAGEEEGRLLAATAYKIESNGIKLKDISGGSSPTALATAQAASGPCAVNEIRPGTYIFNDLLLCNENVAHYEDIALCVAATVVSCPREDYAVIDGGTKCFPTDQPLNVAPFFHTSYAQIEGHDHLRLSRMNEEHGIINSVTGKTGLSVGQVLTLIPIHVCTAVNLHNSAYLLEDGKLRREIIAARGMLV